MMAELEQEFPLRQCLDLVHGIQCEAQQWQQLETTELHAVHDHILESFLIATTMKDCSILISIGRGAPAPFEHVIDFEQERYKVVIAIVDLDIKLSSKLDKYYTLDQDIVQHYVRTRGLHHRMCSVESKACPERIVQIKGNLMCRVLYPNPVCLLTVYCPKLQRFNVMTITWLTCIDNVVRAIHLVASFA